MTIVINGTTGISGVDGSAGTPAVQGTDTNTGVFYPAADTVGVSTGGSERVRVDSSGNVGIGTSSPAAKLDVRTAAGTAVQQNLYTGSNAASATLQFAQVGSVGWNTGITATTGDFQIDINTGGVGYKIVRTGNAIDYHSWLTAGSERMRIDSSGNVGIGQSSITQAFGGYTQLNISGSNGATIQMQSGATSRANFVADGNALYIAGLSGSIAFGVNGTGTGTEVGRFTSTGLFQFNSGYGSVATAYGCRAWVNFDGVTTATIRASGNVTSVTRNSAGDYTINFTNAMPDVNYCVTSSNKYDNANTSFANGVTVVARYTTAYQTGSVRVQTGISAATDTVAVCVAIFR